MNPFAMRHFGHAQAPHPSKKIVSTCREHWCLSAYKRSTLFPASSRYITLHTLKTPAIWLAENILNRNSRTRIFPGKYNSNMIFHFRLFLEKFNDKIFQKMQKIPFAGHFCPFLSRTGQMIIFYENRALPVFSSH